MITNNLKNSLVLLRFPFSVFLLPTFFFAWSQCEDINYFHLALVFFILHFLVYPSSNGYNSYMDRDTGSIGGLKSPPPPNKLLLQLTYVFDTLAILLSLLVNWYFTAGLLVYILCSRAYSYRGIRLKKYPITGFLTVFLVQGAFTFYMIFKGITTNPHETPPLLCMLASSFLIGALYPLTQVYQHEDDKADGVTSISYLLGYRGTFLFSSLLFVLAEIVLYVYFSRQGNLKAFYVFSFSLLPAVAYFFYWFSRVYVNQKAANFKNSLMMNIIAATGTNTAFILLTFFKF